MLAKNFRRLMKKFVERLKKAPRESEPEEAEKKDPRGPWCFECSGFGHIRADCRNLKQDKGNANNATLSDELEEEEETPAQDQKFLAFVAPHEDQKDSQSYYSVNSDEDGEELKEAYKVLYVKYLELRETRQQHVQELNSLQIEKSSLLLKIQDLGEKLLETHLQLERVTNEKLTYMLSIQKSLTDKIGLGYVASTSDIPSTSKTVFVNPTVLEPPTNCVDKGKGSNWWRCSSCCKGHSKASYQKKASYMPPLWFKWSHSTLVFPSQGLSGHIRRSRRSCQDKLHTTLLHGIKLHSINCNNSDLFLPIKMANTRQTNQGTTWRSCKSLKAPIL